MVYASIRGKYCIPSCHLYLPVVTFESLQKDNHAVVQVSFQLIKEVNNDVFKAQFTFYYFNDVHHSSSQYLRNEMDKVVMSKC